MTPTKNLHIAGTKSGKNYVNYSVEISEARDFEIQDVSLVGYEAPLKCYYYDKATQLSSSNKKTPFPKGTYIMSFQIDEQSKFEQTDQVKITLKIGDKIKEQTLDVQKGKTVVGK